MSCNSKRWLVPGIFAFQNFVHKIWLGAKEKIKLTFSWYLLKASYFEKSHTCIGYFGLFTKLKRHMELVFTVGFLHTFSIKMFHIKYPIERRNFNIWEEWPSQSKHYNLNWLNRCLTNPMVIIAFSTILTWNTPGALKKSTLLQSPWQTSGQNRYSTVIKSD